LIKDLVERTGLTVASLYNAYGDKRGIFANGPDHYIETALGRASGVARRCQPVTHTFVFRGHPAFAR
jgi:TetR/AcrR family transcriptional regulator, transcriptional repressor for nem operon